MSDNRMTKLKCYIKCIDDMTDDLLEIADALEEHQINVKLDNGRYLNPVSAIRSKVDVIWGETQAIAATLGSGTLTAEQVREAIMSADRWEKPMGNTGLTNTHLIIRDDAWQAIADELNAELGSGTCEQVLTDCNDGLMPPFTAHCSACGAEWGFTPKYCYNCGARVTGTRDERKAVKR